MGSEDDTKKERSEKIISKRGNKAKGYDTRLRVSHLIDSILIEYFSDVDLGLHFDQNDSILFLFFCTKDIFLAARPAKTKKRHRRDSVRG